MREGLVMISGAKTGRMFLLGALVALAAVLAVVLMTGNSPETPAASADSLAAPQSAPAEAGYISIEGIMGESKDKAHQDWIDLESFSHSISGAPASSDPKGGTSDVTGSATVRDFVFTKKVDKASPLLMEAALTGGNIDEVIFEVTASGPTPFTYLRYRFQDVVITNYRVNGAASGDVAPTETISFIFRTINVTYNPQKEDGSSGEPVEAGWDLVQNKPA